MKHTNIDWCPLVPKNWKECLFKHCVEIYNGKDYKDIESTEGIPVIGSGGAFAFCTDIMYSGEVIFLGRKGTIDKPLYYNGPFWAVDTMFYSVPKKGIWPKYIYYLATCFPFKKISTQTALPSMTQTALRNIRLYIPPVEEQQAIAEYLDKKTAEIDNQISILEEKQQAYIKLKKSLISEVITRGLNPNKEMVDSGIEWIGQIPSHWDVKRFKAFAKTIKGKSLDVLTEPTEGSVKVLSVEALRQDEAQFYDYIQVDDKKQLCTPNDIVVIWDGAGVGEFLKAKDGVLSSTIAKIQLTNKSVILPYLWYWRYKIEYRLKSIPTGMGIPHLNPTLLNNFMIAIPPIEEQRAIAEYLDKKNTEIDKNISLIEQKIAAYKRLKQSLIDEVVTGKRKIN